MPLRRHDSYGRPLPSLTSREDVSASHANVEQRERIMDLVRRTLEDQYPYLLRRDVTAEVTMTFNVLRGVIQDTLYLGIVRKYREGED